MGQLKQIEEWEEIAGNTKEFNIKKLSLYLELVKEEYNELLEAIDDVKKTDPIACKKAAEEAADLIFVLTNLVRYLNLDLEETLQAVIDRNFDKFLPDTISSIKIAKEINGSQVYYLDTKGEDKEIVISQNKGYLVLKDKKTGKVLKPNSYLKKHEI